MSCSLACSFYSAWWLRQTVYGMHLSTCCCAVLQVSAFTNGRTEVSMEDCLLLQHVMWQRPEESEKIGNFLLKQLAQGGDVSSFDWTLDGVRLACMTV